MKRKFLSLFLVLLMLFSLFPPAALAEGEEDESPSGETIGTAAPGEPADPDEPTADPDEPDPGSTAEDPSTPPDGLAPDDTGDEPGALPPEDEADLPEGVIASGSCGANGDDVTWTLDDAGVLTISGVGMIANYTSTTDGRAPWNQYRSQINTIVLEDGVTRVGNWAFWLCSSAQELYLSPNLESIGMYAFRACTGLTSVTIPGSCTTTGGYAFEQCTSLSEVTIQEGVTSISSMCFQDCTSLTRLAIPASVTSVGQYAFRRSALSEITFTGDAPSFNADAFSAITAAVYYPGLNPTWTESVRQNYGGTITWVPVIDCDLYILGRGITDDNLSGLIGGSLAYSYDPGTKVLHLSGSYAMQAGDGEQFLLNRGVNGLKIVLDGNVTLNGPNGVSDDAEISHLVLNADTTITSANGTSSLQLSGGDSGFTTAIAVGDGATLTLEQIDLRVNGVTYGLRGGDAGTSRLNLYHGTTAYIRSYWGSVVRFGGGISWYENVEITEPENWTVNDEYSICKSNGTSLATTVRIEIVYNLTIDGVQITEANRSDVLGNGVFSFDGVHTLTVNGSYTGTAANLIDSELTALVIEGYGALNSSSDASATALIRARGDLFIAGTLSLRHGNNAGDDSCGIRMEGNSRLSVQGTLIVKNVAYGLLGADDNREQTLQIYGADMTVNSFTAAATGFEGGITVEECAFVYPAYTLAQDGALVLDSIWGITPINNVEITAQEAYDLIIDGVRVYAGNKDDILGAGVFSYDPTSKTLTVSGTYAPGTVPSGWSINKAQPVIDSSIFGLTILVEGDSTLTAYLENYNSYTPVIQSLSTLTIKGANNPEPPVLRLVSASSSVAYDGVHCMWVGVENVDLRIGEIGKLPRYGFLCKSSDSIFYTLWFQNACAEIMTKSDGAAATGYSGINMTGCGIITEGVSVQDGAFVQDGDPATWVEISNEVYDLYVWGQRIHGGNLEGMFYRYDPQSKTLYLNASGTYSCSSLPFIENHIDGLTIYVEENIQLATTSIEPDSGLIQSTGDLTIRSAPFGENSLRSLLLVGNEASYGILMLDGASLNLLQTELLVSNVHHGLEALDDSSQLRVFASLVDVETADSGFDAIKGFAGDFSLEECVIVEPQNAEIENGTIYQEDGQIAQHVRIYPNSLLLIVSFDVQGHGTAPASQSVPKGECAAEPSAPTEDGWIFGGWYTDPACTTPYDFATPVTAHLTLYAKWTETYELWLGSTEVTVENAADILGDGTASYDPATQTLRFTVAEPNIRDLYDWELLGTRFRGVIWSLHDLNIQTPGELKLVNHLTYGGVLNWNSSMIHVNGDLNIDGDLTIDCDATYGVNCSGLTVNGSVSIDNETYSEMDGALLSCWGDVHIAGDFYGRTSSTYGIYFSNGELRVDGDVTIRNKHSSGWGIRGGGDQLFSGTVILGPGVWDVQAYYEAIRANTGIVLPDTHRITTPEGGLVTTRSNYTTITEADGTTVAAHVIVEPILSYDLWICGVQVNDENKDDVLGDGNISFDPESSVLTLNGSYELDDTVFLKAEMDLTVTGSAEVTVLGESAVDLYLNKFTADSGANLVFNGNRNTFFARELIVDGGSLTITDSMNSAVHCDTVTLNSGSLRVESSCWAFRGITMAGTGSLTVNGGSLYAQCTRGGSYSPICVDTVTVNGGVLEAVHTRGGAALEATSGVTIAETHIIGTPASGMVKQLTTDSGSYYTVIEANSDAPASHVVIEPGQGYDLWISGVQVTSGNKDDVLGDGNISFDPESSVLTLNGSYELDDTVFLKAEMDLTVTGSAEVTVLGKSAVNLYHNKFTADSGANLVFNGNSNTFYARELVVDGGSLTITDSMNSAVHCNIVTVNSGSLRVESSCWAFRGITMAGTGSITVNGGSLYAQCTRGGSYSPICVDTVTVNGGVLEAVHTRGGAALEAKSGVTIAETHRIGTPANGAVKQLTTDSGSYYTVTEANSDTPASHVVIEPKPTHIPGDVDGDGRVTMADVTLLAKYVKARGQGVDIVPGSGNVDGSADGKITVADVALLAKYVKARGVGVVIY